jgi:hypothetical protein
MRHKNFLLGLLLVLVSTNCTKAQQGEFIPETEVFKTFLAKFPVEVTPVYKAADAPKDILGTDEMTDFDGDMWERYLTDTEVARFVKGKIPFDMESVCYLGCMAAARVKTKLMSNDKFALLLIAKDSEMGCGEEDFLVVYNRKGEVVDYLVVFGRYTDTEIPLLRTPTSYTPYSFYSIIEDDYITILKKERYFKVENGEYKHYKTVYILRKYVISEEGKFVMKSEEVKERKEN